jgi:Tfp pilus assembly protein PilF
MVAGQWLPPDTLAALLPLETHGIDERLEAAYDAGGIDAALAEYQTLKGSNRHNQHFYSATTLNNAGYLLMNAGKMDEAAKILALNLAEYPEDPNSYDSMAEVYMKMGNSARAVELYRKSLEMDPGNENAVKMLAELGAR